MKPTKLDKQDSTAARSGGVAFADGVIVPSTSSVLLRLPRRIRARYVFVMSWRYSVNRVAAPMHTTRTPVARGSRVPVWPIFVPRGNQRWTRSTA